MSSPQMLNLMKSQEQSIFAVLGLIFDELCFFLLVSSGECVNQIYMILYFVTDHHHYFPFS